MIIKKELSPEFKVKLIVKLLNSLEDCRGLFGNVFFVIKTSDTVHLCLVIKNVFVSELVLIRIIAKPPCVPRRKGGAFIWSVFVAMFQNKIPENRIRVKVGALNLLGNK